MGTTRKIARTGRGATPKTETKGGKRGGAQPKKTATKAIEGQRSAKNPQRTARLAGGLRASRNASATKGAR